MPKKQKNTRRGNNEGSISEYKNGMWRAQVTVGYDDNGKVIRKQIYGHSRAEVAVKMTAILANSASGGHASIKNDDFQTLLKEWLLTFKRAVVSPRTFERDLRFASLHINPFIGAMKLQEINSPAVQRLLNKLQMDGYALDTVKHIKHLLRQFFEYAVDSNFVQTNPVDRVKIQSRERKIVTEDEYKAIPIELRMKFLDILDKHEILKPICHAMLFAGLRTGEVLALKWKDIDFDNRTIRVDNAITTIPEYDKNWKVKSRTTVISDTKTAASVREVPIPEILFDTLENWKKIRWLREKTTGKSFTALSDLVFSTNDGELRTYYGIRSMFARLMNDNGLGDYGIHFHTLRHTYSAMLFEAGENPKVIQMLLGHKEVTTTLMHYNSIDRSYFKQATDKIESRLKKPQTEM